MGWQILASALPAFILGHSAVAVAMFAPSHKRLWLAVAYAGYGVTVACMVVGIMWLIWS